LGGPNEIHTTFGIFLQGFIAGLIGIIFFASLLVLMNNVEVKEVWQALRSKFWKAKAAAPEQEGL
jgi:hypothetical protein